MASRAVCCDEVCLVNLSRINKDDGWEFMSEAASVHHFFMVCQAGSCAVQCIEMQLGPELHIFAASILSFGVERVYATQYGGHGQGY